MPAELILLHLPKTGGSSTLAALQSAVSPVGGPCVRVNEFHMRRPENQIAPEAKVVITVRDPVARVVSSFNWRNPFRHAGIGHLGRELPLYECFANVSAFAEALDDDTTCGTIARAAIGHFPSDHPKHAPLPNPMMTQGILWYVQPGGLQNFIQTQYAIVHTESLVQDNHIVQQWLGCKDFDHFLSVRNADYPGRHDTTLTERGHNLLRAALKDEYEALVMLERHATANGVPPLPPPMPPPFPATPPPSKPSSPELPPSPSPAASSSHSFAAAAVVSSAAFATIGPVLDIVLPILAAAGLLYVLFLRRCLLVRCQNHHEGKQTRREQLRGRRASQPDCAGLGVDLPPTCMRDHGALRRGFRGLLPLGTKRHMRLVNEPDRSEQELSASPLADGKDGSGVSPDSMLVVNDDEHPRRAMRSFTKFHTQQQTPLSVPADLD